MLKDKIKIVHYDKGRASEVSRVRSQFAASAAYADSFLVLAELGDTGASKLWPVHQLVRHFKSESSTVPRLLQEIKVGWWLASEAKKGRWEMLHAHQNTSLVVACVWLILCNKPLIFDTHDFISPAEIASSKITRRLSAYIKWNFLQKIVFSKAQCCIHVSPGIVAACEKLVPNANHRLIWNLPAYLLDKPLIESTPGLASNGLTSGPRKMHEIRGDLRLVYFGLLDSTRFSIPMIDSICQIPGVTLLLYGRVYDQYSDDAAQYKKELREIVLKHNVLWEKYTTSELPDILRGADLLFFPLKDTGPNATYALPNKLFEACSSSLGILYSKPLLDMHKILSSHKCGIAIDSDDIKSTKVAIELLRDDPEIVRSLKANAWKLMNDSDWTAGQYINNLKKIYFNAAHRPMDAT